MNQPAPTPQHPPGRPAANASANTLAPPRERWTTTAPGRRLALHRGAAACVALAWPPARGQSPARPTVAPLPLARLLLGAPPGGVGDLMARRLAERLRGHYAQSVIVENRPGAGGQLAAAALKDGPDDGSLLLLSPSSLVSLFPATYRRLPYRPDTDLLPVSLVAWSSLAIGVGPAVPAQVRQLDDLLAWARAHPAAASYGSAAAGSMSHLLLAALAHARDTPLTHAAYRGSVLALQDLRGGTLPIVSAPVGGFLPHLRSAAGGEAVRVLAVSGPQRSPLLPQVPTLREQGHPLAVREWYGFFLPGRARPAAQQRASEALQAALAQPDWPDTLAGLGLEPPGANPAPLAELVRSDSAQWRALVQRIGFTADS